MHEIIRPQFTVEQIREQDPPAYAAVQRFLLALIRVGPDHARVVGVEAALEDYELCMDEGLLRPYMDENGIHAEIWDAKRGEYVIVE